MMPWVGTHDEAAGITRATSIEASPSYWSWDGLEAAWSLPARSMRRLPRIRHTRELVKNRAYYTWLHPLADRLSDLFAAGLPSRRENRAAHVLMPRFRLMN
jgi:hypothetical protein